MIVQMIRLVIDPADAPAFVEIVRDMAGKVVPLPGVARVEWLQAPETPDRCVILIACETRETLQAINRGSDMQAARARVARMVTAPVGVEQYESLPLDD